MSRRENRKKVKAESPKSSSPSSNSFERTSKQENDGDIKQVCYDLGMKAN